MFLIRERDDLDQAVVAAMESLQKENEKLRDELAFIQGGKIEVEIHENDVAEEAYRRASAEVSRLSKSNRELKGALKKVTGELAGTKERLLQELAVERQVNRDLQTLISFIDTEELLGDINKLSEENEKLQKENFSLTLEVKELKEKIHGRERHRSRSAQETNYTPYKPKDMPRHIIEMRGRNGKVFIKHRDDILEFNGDTFNDSLIAAIQALRQPCKVETQSATIKSRFELPEIRQVLIEGNHLWD